MMWEFHLAGRASTTDLGGGHARVWQAPAGTWSARLTIHRKEHWRHDFDTVDDAKAWCEEQLSKLVAQDRGSG